MLTWHEGKGWGFQAGVLKGDFAHSEARGYAYPWVRVPMGTRTHGYAYLRLYPWVRVPTKLNIEMKNLDMSRFLKNRRQYANEIFDLIMQKK